jgi:hypothetical protein
MKLHMLLPVLLIGSVGCATIVSSGPTDITFLSDPPEAEVVVNGHSQGETPVTVPLHAEKSNVIQFYSSGCRDLTVVPKTSVGVGYVIADLFLPFGLITDLITQEWKGFSEETITGQMDCA